jgi:hypothetical protein
MNGIMEQVTRDVSRERYGIFAMSRPEPALPGAFAHPIETKDCNFLPRTLETVPEALAAIQGLPAHILKWGRWQTALKALNYAATAKTNQAEYINVAVTEIRATLLAKGWLR